MTTLPLRAIIAEDDTLIATVIQDALAQINIQVVGVAADGQQAVELTRRAQPDVVLMDIEMPEMDGITATQRIQDECPTPVIILTAHTDTERLQQAALAGVGAYLVKPPQPADLERAIIIARARFDDLLKLRHLNFELSAYDHLVSHDLKNPLGNIFTAAEFLLVEHAALPDAEVERWLTNISQQAHRASSVIESLLLLGQPDKIECVQLDLAIIVAAARTNLSSMIEQTRAEIHGPDTWPTAYGHPELIEQVWVNYLSNALKYSQHAPRVELGAELEAGQVRCWVQDHGRGLSPDKVRLLFKPYSRLSDSDTKGYGLGLYLARRIIERLGGTVGVESSGIAGEGSLFYFTLPDHGR